MTASPAIPNAKASKTADSGSLSQLVYFVTVIVEVILAFRLLLRLLGVSDSGALIHAIYKISYFLIWPFMHLLNQTIDYTAPSFELATLTAMLVYAVLGYVLVLIIQRLEHKF